MAKPRLKGTALAKRRQEVAQMNLAGMTLAQIGERLGVDAATVCRDLAWVREEWRKTAVQDYDQARAIELARLNLVERRYWEAWERSREDKVTRIEAYGSPGAQCGTTLDHDTELRATYRWEKTETQAGKPSFLEGVLKCIDKRRKLMELGRRKEEKTGREGSRAANVVAHGPSSLGGEESEAALHSMHCVISTVSDWTGAGTQCSVLSTGIHRVTAPANESPTPPSGTRERTASESCATALHAMYCVTHVSAACAADFGRHSEHRESQWHPHTEAGDQRGGGKAMRHCSPCIALNARALPFPAKTHYLFQAHLACAQTGCRNHRMGFATLVGVLVMAAFHFCSVEQAFSAPKTGTVLPARNALGKRTHRPW